MKYIEDGFSDAKFKCNTGKHNIFLIGDSIRRGYCETVKMELSDVAEVFYVDDNCRNTQYVITSLKQWSGMFDFATTTPMNPDGPVGVNPRYNDEIDRYNEIAVKIAMDNGLIVNDLNKITRDWNSENYADYCHFTESAFTILGEAVARNLKGLL